MSQIAIKRKVLKLTICLIVVSVSICLLNFIYLYG